MVLKKMPPVAWVESDSVSHKRQLYQAVMG
jgi:hypothetical protein